MRESSFILKDGTQINKLEWHIAQPRAHLLFVHGYAEHVGRYGKFGQHLNKYGISFTGYDQRGFGKSAGLKAYVKSFDQLVDDLEEVVHSIDVKEPLFIMGHSMGGLVAVNYAINRDISKVKGIISSSGALELDPNLSPILQRLAPIIAFFFPKLPTEPLDKTYLTRDPDNLDRYMKDPLIYLKGTRARTGAEIIKTIKSTSQKFEGVRLPLLVLHGDADRLTMPGGSKSLYENAHSKDKTIKIYPGLYHELVFEPEKEEVMKDISNWIIERANE